MSISSLMRAINRRNAKIAEIDRTQAKYELSKYASSHFNYDFNEPEDKVIEEYLSWKKHNKNGSFEEWYKQRK